MEFKEFLCEIQGGFQENIKDYLIEFLICVII